MKSILVLSFFPAFVPPSNGGESRLLGFYKALSRHYRVVLLSSTGPAMPRETVLHTPTFVEKRIPRDKAFLEAWQQLEPFSSGGDLSAPALLRAGGSFNALHQAFLDEYAGVDAVVHESPFTLGFDLFLGCDNKPRIYCAYNCEADLYKVLHPTAKSEPLVQEIQLAEKNLLASVDALFYCGEGDLQHMAEFADLSALQTLYTPHGVNLLPVVFPEPTPTGANALPQVYFVGSAHPPNIQAADFIAKELAPALPHVVFHLIGACGQALKSHGNLVVHGFVSEPEKQAIVSQCDLAINPLTTGGGASLKILDFVLAGKPVLSTDHGMRGYGFKPQVHFIQTELDGFRQSLVDALGMPAAARHAMACDALRYVSENLSWNAVTDRAAAAIAELIEKRRLAEKHVLVLNDHNSFEAVGGGATRTQGLCNALGRQGSVVFLAYSSKQRVRNYTAGAIRVLELPRSVRLEKEVDTARGLSHISVSDILTSVCLPEDALMQNVYATLRLDAAMVVVEHCYMAQLPLQWGDRFVYSSQNNETDLKTGLLAGHPQRDFLCNHVEEIEQRCVATAALTVAVSAEDALAFSAGSWCSSPIVVVPNGVSAPVVSSDNAESTTPQFERLCASETNVVFLGSAHMPNVFAARFLVDEVVRKCPDLSFHFVGSVCVSVIDPPANLTLWGVVDAALKSQILEHCQVALNPVLDGSGSNVKFADYLAHGLPTLSTEFGLRGYPVEARQVALVAEKGNFAAALQKLMAQPALWSTHERSIRRQIFRDLLDFGPIADRFADLVWRINKPRNNVLFVTYRYTNPAKGGAEIFARHLIEALDQTGQYNIDVVATDAGQISDPTRFSSGFQPEAAATFHDLPYTRVVRFPARVQQHAQLIESARPAWNAHMAFERALWQLRKVEEAVVGADKRVGALLWGWAPPEGSVGKAARWAFKSAGVQVRVAGLVEIHAQVLTPAWVKVIAADGHTFAEQKVDGAFSLSFLLTQPCEIEIDTTCTLLEQDARPLALLVKSLKVDGQLMDLSVARPIDISMLKQHWGEQKMIDCLALASEQSRCALGVELSSVRGPHSPLLENYLDQYAGQYDLVVTHNVVFKTAKLAIDAAHQHNVPSILVPHVHLDDDYYHFPDLLETAQKSSLVLASPTAAVNYYRARQCKVGYLPAGIDAAEFAVPPGTDSLKAFDALYGSNLPFVLVLGRKSGAKNYQATLKAVHEINRQGHALNVVMIGPDDDQLPIDLPHVHYFGAQPREVVLAALHNCMALCNMSESESFGIVLLEAWMAGKPVVANAQCGAFAELGDHNVNSLMVTEDTLQAALLALFLEPALCSRLGKAGQQAAKAYTWHAMRIQFTEQTQSLLSYSSN